MCIHIHVWASLVAQWLKSLTAMQETRVQALGWEDPLEKKMATHSNILAWKIPWTEKPGGLQSVGQQTVGHNWAHTDTHTSLAPKGDSISLGWARYIMLGIGNHYFSYESRLLYFKKSPELWGRGERPTLFSWVDAEGGVIQKEVFVLGSNCMSCP